MYPLSNSTANFIFILIRAQLSKLAFKPPAPFHCSYLSRHLSRYSKLKIVDQAPHSISHLAHRRSHIQSLNADVLLDRETRK
jgi:hypothetical protein